MTEWIAVTLTWAVTEFHAFQYEECEVELNKVRDA